MSNYAITTRDRLILNFIASEESSGQYDAVYPGSSQRAEILEFKIQQIIDEQDQILKNPIADQYSRNTAIGRYQLVRDQVAAASDYLGLDRNLNKYTNGIQDAMCMEILKNNCKYNEWLADEIPTNEFQFFLSGQFESIPVPCEKSDKTKRLGRVGSLIADHDCDTCTDSLDDIKATTPEDDIKVPIAINTSSGVTPKQGTSLGRIAENATVGAPFTGGHPGISQNLVQLPPVDNPYLYEPIDPFDDRYDFRTGKKVVDIGINGTLAATQNSVPAPENSTDTPGVQGDPAADAEADDRARLENNEPERVPDQVGDVRIRSEVVDTPGGPERVIKREATVNTPGGLEVVDVTNRVKPTAKALPAPPSSSGPF
jgi:hypothetical protein